MFLEWVLQICRKEWLSTTFVGIGKFWILSASIEFSEFFKNYEFERWYSKSGLWIIWLGALAPLQLDCLLVIQQSFWMMHTLHCLCSKVSVGDFRIFPGHLRAKCLISLHPVQCFSWAGHNFDLLQCLVCCPHLLQLVFKGNGFSWKQVFSLFHSCDLMHFLVTKFVSTPNLPAFHSSHRISWIALPISCLQLWATIHC